MCITYVYNLYILYTDKFCIISYCIIIVMYNYVTLIYLCIFKRVYGSIYMYRIIHMQVHREIELYSLFVLFSFTFCVAIYCIPTSS